MLGQTIRVCLLQEACFLIIVLQFGKSDVALCISEIS